MQVPLTLMMTQWHYTWDTTTEAHRISCMLVGL